MTSKVPALLPSGKSTVFVVKPSMSVTAVLLVMQSVIAVCGKRGRFSRVCQSQVSRSYKPAKPQAGRPLLILRAPLLLTCLPLVLEACSQHRCQ